MKSVFTLMVILGGFALGTLGEGITGSWSGKLGILPTPALKEMSLSLDYTVAGWKLTSTSSFEDETFKSQEFALEGTLGPFQITGSMVFSPVDEELEKISYVIPDDWTGFGYDLTYIDDHWTVAGPHFQKLSLKSSLDFAGVASNLEVALSRNQLITIDAYGNVSKYILYLSFPSYIEDPEHTWMMQRDPTRSPYVERAFESPYGKYFVSYGDIKLIATKVTFSGKDNDGKPVSYTLEGEFEVYYFDASTGQIILTPGAEAYVWQFIADYGGKHNWDLSTVTTYTIDPKDVEATFLFPTYMTYTFTAEVDPLKATIVFDDVCTGTQFKEATLNLDNLSLCCGMEYDLEVKFTKAHGFEYAKFSTDLFEICCGISFGMDLEFGVDYKKVVPKFSWAGIEGCVEVWGDVQAMEKPAVGIEGLELYGFKIHCELAECTYIEFVEAFDPTYVDKHFLGITHPSQEWADVFEAEKNENEYLKFGFCGPGCCGGTWSLDTSVFFSAEVDPTLFGITRFLVETEVPLMDALSVSLDFGYNVPDTETTLIFGWTFTF